ncbi:MAG: hypothetical protein COZ16_04915 [Flavobacteriaceae bacterium CG_4_10_14_3_um_filter_31_253]|nr:MAG: hypothetical protein COW43_05520 [Flavobacteriaceae bacterium CG17_big_fil_post_rev_8_21_14_2_50_31_13]PIX12708.1 MAG: hypothetical protein COZ74_10080 [Flavobacteriaceae bacterium CG_4_8_14_3_um_filter_31_8]PIY15190.1 MAG: hypothetical protein COZ16_04915 [Flavobacteriaceae bacterium CG_4_10_14_3_um_filter_31_253]PIZ09682.1 MAG: hypothetical protein COY55_11605 [Flavobacteriaceae bacterium CG_4_10_14_0_8_um_filter_31_99]PJC10092.1 MAG: hypothetical protein CO067_06450 [Flavobacteriacea
MVEKICVKFVNILNLIRLEFKRKFGKQKEKKSLKGLFLVILLVMVLYLWFNADSLIKSIF